MTGTRLWSMVLAAALLLALPLPAAQTLGEKERFTAIAIVNNNRASGSGIVQIDIDRWSTAAEREALLNTLKKQGAQKLLDALQGTKPVGIIKTPDSLGYDLHYANQTPLPDGGRRIVIATDRPIATRSFPPNPAGNARHFVTPWCGLMGHNLRRRNGKRAGAPDRPALPAAARARARLTVPEHVHSRAT